MKLKWIKIAENIADLPFNNEGLVEMEVNGKNLCISVFREEIRVCAAKCPHASGKMAQGYIDSLGNVVCPLHRYRFDPKTGKNTSGEGYYIKSYKVEMRPEGIFIGFEENNLKFW